MTITSATLTLGCAGLSSSDPTSHITFRADQKCYLTVADDCPPDIPCNPPPPEEVACPPIDEQRIIPRADGTCERKVALDCPADTSCSSVAHPTPCPPSTVQSITRDDDGACTAVRELECPDDARCEASPPTPIGCPSALTEPGMITQSYVYGCLLDYEPVACPPEIPARPLRDDYDVRANGDGTCMAMYIGPFDCPPDATCNPPPPQRITCPPDMAP